jgi:hypothetical protein
MAGKSVFASTTVLNLFLRNTSYVPPAALYVGLYSTAPIDNTGAGGVEISGTGYARQTITFSAPTVTSGNAGAQASNAGTATFGPNTGADWPTAVAFGIFDAAAAGHLLYSGALSANKTVQAGDSAAFTAGALTVTED